MDLFVWFKDGAPVHFQLCIDKLKSGKIESWKIKPYKIEP